MIWDKLSPFYDSMETVYNGKCYRGIADKIKECVTEEDVVLECACGTLALPFKDDMFDVVVAANVIHLLNEPEKAISELKRVCKPNGKIILPVYINNEKKNAIVVAKLLSVLGVKFKRQFSLASYKEFITSHHISRVGYSVVEGRMPCVFAIITNC